MLLLGFLIIVAAAIMSMDGPIDDEIKRNLWKS